MDFKDLMIWREEHGLDGSYEATRESLAASADLKRKQQKENPEQPKQTPPDAWIEEVFPQ